MGDSNCIEQGLASSELKYRRLFETAQDGILSRIPESASNAMIALWVGLFARFNNLVSSILLKLGNIFYAPWAGRHSLSGSLSSSRS